MADLTACVVSAESAKTVAETAINEMKSDLADGRSQTAKMEEEVSGVKTAAAFERLEAYDR